ncbi:hypothetical protein [Pararhodobacter sp. SW119]|uniref:hypothetical protein n=1 Tax=Pararhodobacter sp. SW119 TaxID=2780075 RepID=UPI0032AEA9FC
MSRPRPPLFLERESYRRRRLMDGARALPVIGLVLLLLPALWRIDRAPNAAAEALYVFTVWALLIVAAALLAGPLRRTETPPPPPVQPPPDRTDESSHAATENAETDNTAPTEAPGRAP